MSESRIFYCPSRNETKEFSSFSYKNDTTTQHNLRDRSSVTVDYYKSDDGDRIDQKDGKFVDKYGVEWVPK